MRLLAATVFSLSLVAHAGAKEDAAEGERLLKQLQEEQAIQVLTRALDRGDETKPEEAELALLLGLARFNLRDEEGAALAFRRAVSASPEAELSKLASPRARALFEKVKAEVEAELAARAKADAQAAQAQKAAQAKEAEQRAEAPPAAVETSPGGSLRKVTGVAVAVAGVAAAAVGVWLISDAYAQRSAAVSEPDALKAKTLFDTGQQHLTLGSVLAIAGGVVVVGGAAIFFWPSDDAPKVSLVWLGSGLGLKGRF